MKKIIFSILGVSLLFLSCQQELIEFQEHEASLFMTNSSRVIETCEPDIQALEESLPETVSLETTLNPAVDAYFNFNILNTDLAATDLKGWCGDVDGYLEGDEGPYEFNVYSSYEEFPTGNFENPQNFKKVNWLMNQDFIGKVSPISDVTYTYGMVQWAIWELLDDNNCVNCYYLTGDDKDGWKQNSAALEAVAMEIVSAADEHGDFEPGCGQQVAIMFIAKDRNPSNQVIQSVIHMVDVPEKEEECKDCEGNVTELTLQYNGTNEAYIEVKTKDEGVNDSKIVFQGNVGPGGTFTIYGNDENGTFGDEIKVYVDGDYVKIKTDCSEDIGPGLIFEDIEVISGKSSNGAYLCPKACAECEGKVNNLTLQYNGAEDANIRVETKKDGENGEKVVFEGMVEAGAEFSFVGNDKKGTLGTEITIYVNDVVNTKIHTSCSQPIGPGLMSGDFEVISGSSREGGDLCPVDTPPGGGDDCNECKGKVTRLDLTYNGTSDALIQVVQKKDNIIAFDNNVMAGDTFTFYGKDDKGTLGTEIIIYVDGFEAQRIHTSCSVEIGAGSVFGDFTVEGGASREGGEFCPVDTPPTVGGDDCGECDGKVTRLELQYSGSGTDSIKIVQKKDGEIVFNGTTNGNPIEIFGEWKKGTLGTEIIIYVNDSESQRIHTSCSVPIGEGSVFGDFTVLSGASLNGGEFCNTEGPS